MEFKRSYPFHDSSKPGWGGFCTQTLFKKEKKRVFFFFFLSANMGKAGAGAPPGSTTEIKQV